MVFYLIYVQFNADYEGKAGFVGEWKPGRFPTIYDTDEAKWAQKFPSSNAAKAYAERMAAAFNGLMYYEVFSYSPDTY